MLKKIEALRKQPKHIKNRYAFWTALVVTLCIALVWSVSVPSRFADTSKEDVATTQSEGVFSRSMGDIKNSFTSMVQNFRQRVEYAQDGGVADDSSPYTLDLNALVASSSFKAEAPKEEVIISTSTTQTATASPPFLR